jgi:ribosomal protein L40E
VVALAEGKHVCGSGYLVAPGVGPNCRSCGSLKLRLKPWMEQVVIKWGRQKTITCGVDVAGGFAEGDEQAAIPAPPAAS